MPAFVPQCQYDVFISYAHVAEKEWTQGFFRKLEEHLDRELHQSNAASIFWDDQEIAGDSPLTAEITQALSKTATLLIVLSKAYLERPWCLRECETFINQAGADSRRTFLVLIEDVPTEKRPLEIKSLDVTGFKFWEIHPDNTNVTRPLPLDRDSFDGMIRGLSWRIAERLRIYKTERSNEAKPIAADRTRVVGSKVFLADGISGPPVKDLDEARSSVRNWLTDKNAVVLPEKKDSLYQAFYDNRSQCEASVNQLLTDAIIFVQLLGRKGDDESYESWLCDRAIAAGKVPGKNLLLWRSQSLTQDSIKDETYRDLVFSEKYQVISCDLAEFQLFLAKRIEDISREQEAQSRINKSVGDGGDTKANESMVAVLVDNAEQDKNLIQNLRQQFNHYKIQYETAEDLQDFCEMIESSSFVGVMFTFGACTEEWAKERLKATRPFRLGKRAGKRIGVYRDNSNRDLPGNSGMDVIIDGDTTSMARFVEKLQGDAQ